MKKFYFTFFYLFIFFFISSCASGYKKIQPNSLHYLSSNELGNVKLEYKYNVLSKKYLKKELKKQVKLATIKIKNNSDKDYVFGGNLKLVYSNGNQVDLIENSKAYTMLKQNTPIYLLYLLLTPMKFEVYETTNGFTETKSSTPIGLVVGPAIAGGNMIVAGSANNKFKEELTSYDLMNKTIKSGETKYGIIAINSNSSESLKLKLD
jgi:hypothetical protein